MPTKRAAIKQASQEEIVSDDSSSREDDQFVISPRPRRVTRKATRGRGASSSWADEKATRVAKGRVVAAVREAMTSNVIQKVEHPLRPNFEYTLRRVDRHHLIGPQTSHWERISQWLIEMKILVIGPLSFMTIDSGTTSMSIGTSP
jgi:hypothetical protein